MISGYVATLQQQLVDSLGGTALADAELLNPPGPGPHARFLAFRSPEAQRWCAELKQKGCIVDLRGDVLRIGLGLYHDEEDIAAFARLAPRS
jgi:selenocysteine lyase/cysteine desulfurase